MANELPGMDEIVRFLQEQKAKEAAQFAKGAPPANPSMSNIPRPSPASMSNVPTGKMMAETHQFPGTQAGPSMGNVPNASKGGGIYSIEGGGQLARKALSGVGRLASGAALASIPLPGGSLMNRAWGAGQGLASLVTGKGRDDQTGEVVGGARGDRLAWEGQHPVTGGLPSVEQVTGQPTIKTESLRTPVADKTSELSLSDLVTGRRSGQKTNPTVAQSAQLAGIPKEEYDYGDSYELPAESVTEVKSAPTETAQVDDLQPQDVERADLQTSGGVSPAAQSEAQQIMEAITKQLNTSAKAPVQETPDAESTKAVSELSKPVAEPKETFGHKVKRFIVAGSGPVNFSRIDEQEATAKQAKNKFTDRESLRGDLAADDIKGSRKFNRESQLQREQTGGATDQSKLAMSALLEQYRMAGADERQIKGIEAEHKARMAEIAANANNQKLAPETAQRQALYGMMTKEPDLFTPDLFKQTFGVDVNPEALKAMTLARGKNDPMALAVAEILKDRLEKLKGTGAGNKSTLKTGSLK